MAETITYEINGTFPPFAAELVLDGNVIASQAHDKIGTYSFRNILESGEFSVVVYDTASGIKTANKNVTTTTTTTTVAPTTTTATPTTTTTVAPTTTATPTTTADPCIAFTFKSAIYSEVSREVAVTIGGTGGEDYIFGMYRRKILLPLNGGKPINVDFAITSPNESIKVGNQIITIDLTDEPNGLYVAKMTGITGAIDGCTEEKTVNVSTTTTTAPPINSIIMSAVYNPNMPTGDGKWKVITTSNPEGMFVVKKEGKTTDKAIRTVDHISTQTIDVTRIDSTLGKPASPLYDGIVIISHVRDGVLIGGATEEPFIAGQLGVKLSVTFAGMQEGDDIDIGIAENGTMIAI